jgi:predicted MPP superfamily phosphohydrolase
MKSFLLLPVLLAFVGCSQSHKVERNDVFVALNEEQLSDSSKTSAPTIRIAVLSDLHVPDNAASLAQLAQIADEVERVRPDVVALLGDYTKQPPSEPLSNSHRLAVSEILGRMTVSTSVVAVLGNHDVWTDSQEWAHALENQGISVLNNRVLDLMLDRTRICIRGLGDIYSGQFEYIEWPADCEAASRITITHDPAGAFQEGVSGLVLAGHTHCGQIRLPLIGAPWTPSTAPSEAQCGLYRDEQRQVFVSAGIGTSVVPWRLGTQAEWDLLRVTF